MIFGVNRTLAAIAAIILGAGLLWMLGDMTVSSIRRHAAADRDIVWERKLLAVEKKHADEKKALQDSINNGAAAERVILATDAAASQSRVLALEAELSALKSDPIFPQSLVRELRR